MSEADNVTRLAATGKTEADIAADLILRTEEAVKPVLALMDEAATHGLVIGWDSLTPGPPYMRYRVDGIRVIKTYLK